MFGLTYAYAIKIKRTVEVYQWEEETIEKSGEETTYKNIQKWSEHEINMNHFAEPWQCEGIKNPSNWPCKSHVFENSNVHIGNYKLNET